MITALILAGAALAGEATPPFTWGGELRYIAGLYPEIPINTDGETADGGFGLDQRLRMGGAWNPGKFRLGGEIDLFTGRLVGNGGRLPGEIDARPASDVGVVSSQSFKLRDLSIRGPVGPVHIAAGLMTSSWGLGMVANDGAHDPMFGRSDMGDRVARLALSTMPLRHNGAPVPWVVTLAGDLVVEDDLAAIRDDQRAWQGVGSTRYTWGSEGFAGLYGVYRVQIEPDDAGETRAGMIDLFARVPLTLGAWTVTSAVEAAGISGHTSRTATYNSIEGVDVLSAGVAGQLSVIVPGGGALLHLRGGWASGDGDPDDDTSHDFTFDRDYDAGMALFDQLAGALEVGLYDQLTDPERAGQPPDGVDALVTEGAFRRAVFAQPTVEGRPRPWLDLKLGMTFAWGTAPVGQSYMTSRHGGVGANYLGEPTSRSPLGSELNWAVEVGRPPEGDGKAAPQLLVSAAHLVPSPTLAGEAADRMDLLLVTGRVRW